MGVVGDGSEHGRHRRWSRAPHPVEAGGVKRDRAEVGLPDIKIY